MISIPFSGSKRYSYKNVKAIIEQGNYETVFEPFGGSCVLSINLLNDNIVKNAVVNDYDHFFDLYPEYLNLKDKVVEEGYKHGLRRTYRGGKDTNWRVSPNGSKEKIKSRVLKDNERRILQEIIIKNVPKKFWRYFALNNFAFSAVASHKTIHINDFILFDGYLKTDKQREYLKVLKRAKIEHLDWKEFLERYKLQLTPLYRTILILDPPYVDTEQKQYSGEFSEEDTIDLIETVKELGCDFIFFNHNEEKVKEWLNGLDYTILKTGSLTASCNHNRKDIMAYVKNSDTQ